MHNHIQAHKVGFLSEDFNTISIGEHIKGIKAWVEDAGRAYEAGNIRLAKAMLKNIAEAINKIK